MSDHSDEKTQCVCHGEDRPHAPHMPCDLGCQPDWHRDGCAVYVRLPPEGRTDS